MINILYAGAAEDWDNYRQYISENLAKRGISARISLDCTAKDVDYIVYRPNSPIQDFSKFPKLKAVLSLWAGVENIVGNETLRVPLCRMVDSGLREGMREWVTGHVLRHHLGMDTHILNQDGVWRHAPRPLARQRSVGILGIGELGLACAQSLQALGFNVIGWSRNPKNIPELECYTSDEGLNEILAKSEILVLLLPQTPETYHILDAKNLAKLPNSAIIINPGRGPLIDDNALLTALDNGQIAHATLDVFATEPLPKDHPFWAHEKVTITPHIASDTHAITASEVIADNIERGEIGQKLLYQVDRTARY